MNKLTDFPPPLFFLFFCLFSFSVIRILCHALHIFEKKKGKMCEKNFKDRVFLLNWHFPEDCGSYVAFE